MLKRGLSFFIFSLSLVFQVFSQNYETKTFTEDGYTYSIVNGDPTETRIYKLANGLTVYLSVYRDKPQIFTLIPIKAGSKHDPKTNTGLAHYLEHMVFKGTSKIGTKDFGKEKLLLDSIENMFSRYIKIKDTTKRKELYKKIDKVSYEASKYCFANEYDKLISVIGGQGTNAFTSNEQTVYLNSIPSNQLEKWLEIERERFSMLVPRLFHTELEAVYEEKNISLDDDNDKVQEALYAELFKKHQYGTQTTIGTVEHLKNPSITEIKKFFYTYYVPNNMAICLAGDLDPAKTIKLIDKTFGTMVPKFVPKFVPPVEDKISAPIIKQVVGPEEESVNLAFRLPGQGTKEAIIAKLIDQMLSNSQAGLMDLNLNQKQLVLGAGAYLDVNKDYSAHIFYGSPKEGQSLAEVRNLILAQLDSIRKGRFEDWLIPAIVNNIKITQYKQYDNNQGRAFAQMNAFVFGENWEQFWKETENLSKITKAQIIEFANQYYGQNYVCIEKVNGKDSKVVKISKPSITPVVLNKEDHSPFYKELMAKPSPSVEPVFLDFRKDLLIKDIRNGLQLLYKRNNSTPIFQLTYLVEMGSIHDPKLDIAARLLDFAGAKNLNGNAFKKELFKLGSSLSVFPGLDQTYITITGLQQNFIQTIELLENLLAQPKVEDDALKSLYSNILKERENQKLDKRSILFGGLSGYGRFGPNSPSNYIVKNKDLPNLKSDELMALTTKLTTYPHKILYYGPEQENNLTDILSKYHKTPPVFVSIPEPKNFKEVETDSNKVFWVDYDMLQTELYFMSKSNNFDPLQVGIASLFNEYMGGNMSSVVFQELRESKALAYSASGGYGLAVQKDKPNYITGYIGCQADKLPEATSSMMLIMNELPLVKSSFDLSKESILSSIRSERITKSSVLFSYLRAQKLGLDYDNRQKVFEEIQKFQPEDLKNFHEKAIANKKYTLLVVGKKDKIDFEHLRKFGPVKELKVDDIFGF